MQLHCRSWWMLALVLSALNTEDAVKMWLLPDCRYTRSTKLTGYLYNCREVRLSKAVVTKIVTNWFPVFCLGAELWSLGSSINKTTSIRDVRGKFHKRVSCWDVFVASPSLHSSLWPTQEAVCWPCPWYNVASDNSTPLTQWISHHWWCAQVIFLRWYLMHLLGAIVIWRWQCVFWNLDILQFRYFRTT